MKTKRIWALASAVAVVAVVAGVLILPASGATTSHQDGCFPVHEVQPDETLDSIAELYGVSILDLLAANELADDVELYAGEQLCIPTTESEAVEAPAVDATAVTTETLAVETSAAAVEALAAQKQSAVPTRICVEGQVINKIHKGIAGVTVVAQRGTAPGMSTQTDKHGRFSFTDLTAGKWVFRVQVPDSWVPVTSEEITVDLDYARAGCYEIRFKLDPRGCIIAQKTDVNGKPLAGWLITASGPIDPEAVTGPDGFAIINDLIPGTYLVSEKPGDSIPTPWIWTPVSPSEVSVEVKAAWSQDDCAEVTFQNEQELTSCIKGYKVDDGHEPIEGWRVYAQPADDEEPVFTTTTAADGSFLFSDLPLGTWTVWEEVPPYWTPITPSKFSVTLDGTGACPVVRFKNRPPDLCAEGYKVDENGKGLAGWTVEAFSAADPAEVLTAVTDETGYYRFNGLTLGEWVFKVQHETGWTPITSDTTKVEMVGADSCAQVPIFRNQSPVGCIEGFKRDNLGYGLAGWNITVETESGKHSQHTFTDGTGYYLFDGLPMGKYTVYEEQQTGWIPVTPTKYEIELKPSDEQVCARVRPFVNKQVPRDICIDGYKLDKIDDVGLPDWPVEAKNLATGAVLETTTDGVGYFRFSDLLPGEYEVTVGDKEGWVHVGPASETVVVSWPPKDACETVKFYNLQEPPDGPDGPHGPDGPDGPKHDGCRAVHTVCFGDTLNKIAEWEDTSVRTIMKANHIPNADVIYPGQELCIP
jgi:LysM repeat protein